MKLIKLKNSIPGILFILPFFIFFIMFMLFPMIKAIQMSLFDLKYAEGPFIGFQNYIELFKNKVFIKSLLNTFLFVLGVLPGTLIFSLFVAVNVYGKSQKLQAFFRGSFYIPIVTSGVVLSVIWIWIYDPVAGIANYILSLFHLPTVEWLSNNHTALLSLVLVVITWTVGVPIVLYMAALGNIPQTYYEVADIDGASKIKKFFYITLPLLKPTSLYVIIWTTIGSFQIFQVVQLMTGGGPNHATSTIMYLLYKEAFIFGRLGSAATMGVILAVIIFLISIIQFKFLSSDVEY